MATTVNLGKIRYNVRGEWGSGTSYVVDDIVTRVGSSYICILAGTNQDPITATTYWTKISSMPRDRGDWSSATTYYQNDVVGITSTLTYNQYYNYQDVEKFICTASSSSNQAPGSTPASWAKISSGTFNKRYAFLGAINEGYVPPLRSLWNAKSGATTGGIGIVTVTSGGSGYTTTSGAPAGLSTATVTFGGGGTGATGVAYVSSTGTISYIDITNPGSGYSNTAGSISVTISGGGTPSATATATAYSYPTRCGMGDTTGQFKGPWHVCFAGGNESYLRYINRNYGLVQLGYQNATYGNGGNASGDADLITPSEAAFIHLEWLEGVLPTPDGQPPKIIQVEASAYATLVLFNNGEVHYAGYNGHGGAGDNTTTNAVSYVRCGYSRTNKSGTSVLRGKKAIRIASSAGGDANDTVSNYALIENSDGTRQIFSWGYNGYGQLGDASVTNRSVPTAITFSEAANGKIVEIWATGGAYGQLFVLTDRGNMYSCGYNGYGQLGLNDTSNRSSLVLVKAWGVGTSRVEKFVAGGGNSASHMMVKQENRTLWSWGYNGYGQLGHNHTNNIYAPLTVYTGGYTGSSGANVVGTLSGSAVTCWDVWLTGPQNICSSYITTGTAVNSTTTFATGYNGYRNLSVGLDDTTQRNVFTAMQINNGTALTNAVEVLGNCSGTSWFNGLMLKRHNGEWYTGGYSNGTNGLGHADAYNIRQVQDPNYTANNYRAKNNILWPQAFDQNFVKFFGRSANTSSGLWAFVYLKTGQIFISLTDNSYGSAGHFTTGSNKFTRLIGH